MTKKRITGMRLRQKTNPRKSTYWIHQLMLSLSGCAALILTVAGLAGFRLGSTLLIMLLTSLLLCGAYAFLVKAERKQWFAPGLLVLMLLLVFLFRQQVLEGWRLYWNQLSGAMTQGRGWVLPQLQTQMPTRQRTLAISLFAVMAAGGISVVSCMLASFAPIVLAAMPPAVMLVGMAVLGIGAEFPLIAVVLTMSMLVLLCSGRGRRNMPMPTVIGWLICTIAAFFLVKTLSAPGVAGWAEDVSSSVRHKIHTAQYETEHSTLPDGDFNRYRITSQKAQPALTVTMEVPESVYLRGFTGSVFLENVWHEVATDDLVKNRELLYWLNLNAFTQDSQFAAAAASLELTPNQITIENTGACSQYLYVPFSLCDGEYLYKENLNTDGAYGDGARSYAYRALAGGSDAISQVLEHLKTSEDASVTQYRRAESAYRQVVYSQYLQVPDEVRELLGEQWNDLAGKYGGTVNLTMHQGQECALRFLGMCFPENGIPEGMELPLDQARGTPYQYATVAVLTMRYFGIPARYAEGYLITEQMAQRAKAGKPIAVDSSCAWAWAEIYQDGIGWIPVDLTPGLGETIEEQPDNTLEGDLEADQKDEEEESEEDTDAASQTPETLGGTVVKIV